MASSSNIFGSKRADRLMATADNQFLYGGADTTLGGTGNDTLGSGVFEDVSLYGGDGNDTLIAKSADLVIDGGDGTDTVQFADSVNDHDDDDWLIDVQNIVITRKASGSYDFSDQSEALNITGGAGADTIYGGSGADTFKGGAGNDELRVAATDQLIDGGMGADKAVFSGDVDSQDLDNAKLVNVERIGFDNLLAGSYDFSNQTEALDMTASDNGDTITGGSGADTIRGGSGNDSLVGGKGNDLLIAEEDDTIDGGDGVDTVQFADDVTSDLGDDDLVHVEKVQLTAEGEYDFSVQTEGLAITGSGYADFITGGTANDNISGLAGHDSLVGGAGNDMLSGGDGYDTLNGGDGVDQLSGGSGNDTLVAEDTDAQIDGGAGTDKVQFAAGVSAVNLLNKDLVNVEIVEITDSGTYDFSAQSEVLTIKGSNQNDFIVGGQAADKFYGDVGNDTLVAQDNDALIDGGADTDKVQFAAAVSATKLLDIDLVNVEVIEITNKGNARYDFSVQTEELEIHGGTGNDIIIGGRNADLILGGKGVDALTGGAGNDVFDFAAGDSGTSSFDRITDFKVGADSLGFGSVESVTEADVDVATESGNKGRTITASITDGVITLDGLDKAKVDTLSEWVAVARAMVDADDEVGAFEFGGSTYVYQENGDADQDLLIQLMGVKGVTDVSDLLPTT